MCDYKIRYLAYKCPHPDYGPGKDEEKTFCIFHNDREDKDLEKFYKGFEKLYKSGKHDFRGFIFPVRFDFNKLKEETGDLEFKEAGFVRAIFSEKADFSGATFSGGANFWGATFSGGAYFVGATFSGEAYFVVATFLGEAYFVGATFLEKSKVIFQGKTFEDGATAHFINLKIEKDADLTFDGINLNRARFIGTDLENINFKEISWQKSGRLVKRNMLYDETFQLGPFESLSIKLKKLLKKEGEFFREKGNHYEVKRLYNLLRINYEKTGRYHEAGDFFVGAMEMRMKGTREGILTKFILFLYKLISLYGERPIRAFLLLFILPFFFSSFYLLSGLNSSGKEVNYDLVFSLRNFGSTFWNDFLQALKYSLSVMTLRRFETNGIIPTDSTFFISIFELIFGATLLSLFVLAMNRKFRRTKN
ncbi:MAG: pentapeptide repeat-containing protein [Deltaproteobacteria bacterium]|uniref:Pentapeptide repeat-containing protein n=1 Tax=Candidatus Zymogenus saltonus TaxID=2844893 RepID=A0A9D8KI48_9DELT|nr:pentapeptide repeat-containing protein [Candidatus Zymogenus saltonus]